MIMIGILFMYEDNPYLKDPDELLHFRKHLTALANYTSDN